MFNKRLEGRSESKLTKALTKLADSSKIEKTGFVTKSAKSSLFKTKSFRLRELDLANFQNIMSYVNKNNDRMDYSHSQIIRGLINYCSDNIEEDCKEMMPYIIISS